MKSRLFLLTLMAPLLLGCAKDDGNSLGSESGRTAYLALTFQMSQQETKADTNTPIQGTPAENAMSQATVLLFDKDGVCLGSVNYSASITGDPSTEAKKVPKDTKKVFAVINPPAGKWALSSDDVKGKSWSTIYKETQSVLASDIATDSKFVMSNAGSADLGLVAVEPSDTEDGAEQAPAKISVDRLCAKVTLTHPDPIPAPNAKFEFQGWELNTINKATALYTEYVTYDNSSTSKVAGVYRKDHNYKDFPAYATSEPTITAYNKYLTDNYTWLHNAPTVSPVEKQKGVIAYCAENTMDATSQQWGHTTKMVVKGQYTPTVNIEGTVAEKGSYFSWNGRYYSLDALKTAYKANAGLKTDLVKFLSKADMYDASITEAADKENNDNIDNALGKSFTGYTGVKARYLALRYYHESVCYYDALIRHDKNVEKLMELGRYGVVRNNMYTINITKINGPGTPWIPDPTDPEDPTKPTDPDDEVPTYLAIDVTVNNWTGWTHDVELGK